MADVDAKLNRTRQLIFDFFSETDPGKLRTGVDVNGMAKWTLENGERALNDLLTRQYGKTIDFERSLSTAQEQADRFSHVHVPKMGGRDAEESLKRNKMSFEEETMKREDLRERLEEFLEDVDPQNATDEYIQGLVNVAMLHGEERLDDDLVEKYGEGILSDDEDEEAETDDDFDFDELKIKQELRIFYLKHDPPYVEEPEHVNQVLGLMGRIGKTAVYAKLAEFYNETVEECVRKYNEDKKPAEPVVVKPVVVKPVVAAPEPEPESEAESEPGPPPFPVRSPPPPIGGNVVNESEEEEEKEKEKEKEQKPVVVTVEEPAVNVSDFDDIDSMRKNLVRYYEKHDPVEIENIDDVIELGMDIGFDKLNQNMETFYGETLVNFIKNNPEKKVKKSKLRMFTQGTISKAENNSSEASTQNKTPSPYGKQKADAHKITTAAPPVLPSMEFKSSKEKANEKPPPQPPRRIPSPLPAVTTKAKEKMEEVAPIDEMLEGIPMGDVFAGVPTEGSNSPPEPPTRAKNININTLPPPPPPEESDEDVSESESVDQPINLPPGPKPSATDSLASLSMFRTDAPPPVTPENHNKPDFTKIPKVLPRAPIVNNSDRNIDLTKLPPADPRFPSVLQSPQMKQNAAVPNVSAGRMTEKSVPPTAPPRVKKPEEGSSPAPPVASATPKLAPRKASFKEMPLPVKQKSLENQGSSPPPRVDKEGSRKKVKKRIDREPPLDPGRPVTYEELKKFYERHDPVKVETIPQIMVVAQTLGRQDLNEKLLQFYGASLQTYERESVATQDASQKPANRISKRRIKKKVRMSNARAQPPPITAADQNQPVKMIQAQKSRPLPTPPTDEYSPPPVAERPIPSPMPQQRIPQVDYEDLPQLREDLVKYYQEVDPGKMGVLDQILQLAKRIGRQQLDEKLFSLYGKSLDAMTDRSPHQKKVSPTPPSNPTDPPRPRIPFGGVDITGKDGSRRNFETSNDRKGSVVEMTNIRVQVMPRMIPIGDIHLKKTGRDATKSLSKKQADKMAKNLNPMYRLPKKRRKKRDPTQRYTQASLKLLAVNLDSMPSSAVPTNKGRISSGQPKVQLNDLLSSVPQKAKNLTDGPCETYKLDMNGKTLGVCTCGYPKGQHLDQLVV